MRLLDLTGQRFGRLTVLKRDHRYTGTRWIVRCDCGNEGRSVHASSLRSGSTSSCGCLRTERSREARSVLTEAQIDEAVEQYCNGASSIALGERYGCSYPVILRHVRKAGRHVRDGSEAARKCELNQAFFDEIDSEEKAYWLGFLSADGCITNENVISLRLAWSDRDHLDKFRLAVGSAHQIIRVENPAGQKRYPAAHVSIRSDRMVSSLRLLGVTPRKSAAMKPASIRSDLARHYWRGMFDGDGSIYRPSSGSGPGVSFVGSHATVMAFAEMARLVCGSRASVRQHSMSKVVHVFETSGKICGSLLLHWMYLGASVYLDRKMKMYADLHASPQKRGAA